MTLQLAAMARPGLLRELQDALAQSGAQLRCTQDAAEFRHWLADCDAALLPVFHYDEAVARAMQSSPRLRWIQLLTVGTEKLQALPPPPRLLVTTAGHSMAAAIAEHAFALLLALSRDLRAGLAGPACEPGALRETIAALSGKRMAVLGYGAIGREVAMRARAFGIHVTGLRRQATPDGIADAVRGMDDLAQVLAASDVLVVAAPLNASTRGLLGRDVLARCRPGTLVINVARGGIVDSDALAELIASGQLGGAGLDVTEPEPLPPGHPLRHLSNVIITPHVAAAGSEASVARFVASNVRRFSAGEPLEAVFRPSN